MAIDVTASQEIDASPSAVSAVQFDPKRDPEWIGGVDRVEVVTEPPVTTGSEVRRMGGFMGRPIEWLMRVEAFEPERHVGMHALQAPFPMDVDYGSSRSTAAVEPGPPSGSAAMPRVCTARCLGR